MHFYIKIPTYIRQYLLSKYGADIVTFPKYSTAATIIISTAVNNINRSCIGSTFCYLAFSEAQRKDFLSFSKDLPKENDLPGLLPVSLPDTLLRGGKYVNTGPSWQLSAIGSTRLREELKHEFWCDLMIYIRDCYIKHVHSNDPQPFNRLATIEDFLTVHAIPVDMLDTINRTYSRERSRILTHLHTHTTTSYSLP